MQVGKEEVNLSLNIENMVIYFKYWKDFLRKLVDMINTSNKIAG
jgi:hypothetical protein